MTKTQDPAELLLEHTEAEMQEAIDGFANACLQHRASFGEEGQDVECSVWFHPDFFTWAVYGCAMGIADNDSMVFFGVRLQEPFLKGKGNLYSFQAP